MDFNSLGQGSPFYILRQGEKPMLDVGVVKTKGQARAKFPTQTPNLMQGMQMQQVIDVVATVNGKDETFSDVPINVEIAQRGNVTFSGSREAMLQAVDTMLQTSKKALEQVPYHKSVISESEKMMQHGFRRMGGSPGANRGGDYRIGNYKDDKYEEGYCEGYKHGFEDASKEMSGGVSELYEGSSRYGRY